MNFQKLVGRHLQKKKKKKVWHSIERKKSQLGGGDAPVLLHPGRVLLQGVEGGAFLDNGEVVLEVVGHESLQAAEVGGVGTAVENATSAAPESRAQHRDRLHQGLQGLQGSTRAATTTTTEDAARGRVEGSSAAEATGQKWHHRTRTQLRSRPRLTWKFIPEWG